MALFFGPLPKEASPAPLYLQIQRVVQDAIGSGQLKPDDALPSERELAANFGISRVTVRKAITGLVDKGVLVQRWGSGTFVAGRIHVDMPLSRLSGFTEDMLARHLAPASRVIEKAIGVCTPSEAIALNLSPGDQVIRLQRLRLAGGVPMAIEHAVVPGSYLPDPELIDGSLYATLVSRGHAPRRALQRLHAVLLNVEQARQLGVSAGNPALYIERRTFLGNGEAIEFTCSYYRGDAYDFVVELSLTEAGGLA